MRKIRDLLRLHADGLSKRQVEDEPKSQRCLDRDVGVLPLPSALARRRRTPGVTRMCGDPECDIASLDQCLVVIGPVAYAVLGLVLRMHSRLHVDIVRPPSSGSPGSRQ